MLGKNSRHLRGDRELHILDPKDMILYLNVSFKDSSSQSSSICQSGDGAAVLAKQCVNTGGQVDLAALGFGASSSKDVKGLPPCNTSGEKNTVIVPHATLDVESILSFS